MKRLYAYYIKLYIKTWYLSILLLPLLIYLGVRSNDVATVIDQPTIVYNMVAMQCSICGLLGFTYFLLCSYEMFYKAGSCGLQETVYATAGGKQRTFVAQLLAMATVVAGYLLVCLATVIFTMVRGLPVTTPFLQNTLLSFVLYVCGPVVIGMLIGAAASLKFKRIPFYTLCLVLVFLISPFSDYLHVAGGFTISDLTTVGAGVFFVRVLGLLSKLQPIYTFNAPNLSMGQALEPFRWQLILFWLCLLGAIIVIALRRPRHRGCKVAAGILAVLCLFNLYGYFAPGCSWNSKTPSTVEDAAKNLFYYQNEPSKYNQTVVPDFAVTDCDLKISMFKQLHGTATLTLNGTNLSEYNFTLHHGYKVKKVTDASGNKLPYRRWYDYLTVQNETGKAITQIVVEYTGTHETYYATAQGCYLPGYCAYYPVEGLYALRDDVLTTDSCIPPTQRNFTIQASGFCPFFSNIEQTSKNIFAGTGYAAIFVGGMYQNVQVGDTNAILPLYEPETDIVQYATQQLDALSQKAGIPLTMPTINTVVFSPSVSLPSVGDASNNIGVAGNTLMLFNSLDGMDYSNLIPQLVKYTLQAPHQKQDCAQLLVAMVQGLIYDDQYVSSWFTSNYGPQPAEEYIALPGVPESEDGQRRVGFYLYKGYLSNNNQQLVLQTMYNYINDDSDTRAPLDFAKDFAAAYTK